MQKRTRLGAVIGAGLLALPLSACTEDDPDVVIDDEETATVEPDTGDDTGGDTGGETEDGTGETEDGGDTGGDTGDDTTN
jgi:hypothetical protein